MQFKSRTAQLNGLTSLAYVGVLPSSPQNFLIKQKAPTINDYRNVYVGDFWLDNSSEYATPGTPATVANLYILVSVDSHVATWRNFDLSGEIRTLTADNLVTVVPTLGNINIFGGTAGRNVSTFGGGSTINVDLKNAITLGDLSVIGAGGNALSAVTGDINVTTGNLKIANTSASGNAGVLEMGGFRFLSNFGGGTSTFLGTLAGNTTNTAGGNSGFGSTVLNVVTSGSVNSGFGSASLNLLTSGSSNVAFGAVSLSSLTTGVGNLALGAGSGSLLTGAESRNILINDPGVTGLNNLFAVTIPSTGGNGFNMHNFPASTGVNGSNCFIGRVCGNRTMTVNATNNFALGDDCLSQITTAPHNIAIGNQTLHELISGDGNVGVGHSCYSKVALNTGLLTGSFNVAVGYTAGSNYTGAESNNINIGVSVGTVGESNVTRIGDFTITPQTKTFIQGIRGRTTVNSNAIAVLIDSAGQLGTVSSSLRYKENVEDMGQDSNILYKLRPVTFNYKKHTAKDKTVGLIAEEVAVQSPQLVVYDSEGIPETVKYHELVPMLLNEIIKLNKRITTLEGV